MEILVSSDNEGLYVITSPGCSQWSVPINFEKAIKQQVSGDKINGIILDLHDISFINSSGLGSIFSLRKYLNSLDATLVLARPTPTIGRLLNTANLPALISVTDDLDQAREIIAEKAK